MSGNKGTDANANVSSLVLSRDYETAHLSSSVSKGKRETEGQEQTFAGLALQPAKCMSTQNGDWGVGTMDRKVLEEPPKFDHWISQLLNGILGCRTTLGPLITNTTPSPFPIYSMIASIYNLPLYQSGYHVLNCIKISYWSLWVMQILRFLSWVRRRRANSCLYSTTQGSSVAGRSSLSTFGHRMAGSKSIPPL